eukprot:jgi/Botrbrau1/19639/Bobra.0003s0009.1
MASTSTVLMVAEKPSLAASIAQHLSDARSHSRRGALDVHEWEGNFQGRRARFKMTSVVGHVYSIDFPAKYQHWDTVDPLSLFDAPTIKNEANPKAHVCRHLQTEAKGCDFLVLWLDCDREGENICFEVMENTVRWLKKGSGQQVYRARFSAITAPLIRAAMGSLGVPNANEAAAVDARQELDLKVGVAFTRFQTRFFQGKYANLDAGVISYGPCQTPTLGFCVERHLSINSFQPEDYWTLRPLVSKSGDELELEWERGRVFDSAVAEVFRSLVAETGWVRVARLEEKEERRSRPPGLNTVELLKVASSAMGIGPHQAMQIAERLYTAGFISYPRTESSAYPPGFDFAEGLREQSRHPIWGDYSSSLLRLGPSAPKGGADVGDHPPITPVRAATEGEVGGGDAWRLYDYITRHFLGSLSPDCVFRRTHVVFSAGNETFTASGVQPLKPGFTAIMPWKAVEGSALPSLKEGEQLRISSVLVKQGKTSPPDHLTESELIGLMEKHGIGTDASIAVHINNICERNYVGIQGGRRVVPTELGVTLIRGYQLIDPELCLPQVRSHVEKQIGLIARGEAEKESVVRHTLAQFTSKFVFFVAKIGRMDALFDATFSTLAESGKPFSKCGKCRRYMKLISGRPTRLYCPTCEEVLDLPQGGTIKLYQELECPLDGYQLVLYSLAGPDGKTMPLCPFCYNNPLEGAGKWGAMGAVKGGMPCTLCPNLGCRHSPGRLGVCVCPECEEGTLVLNPISGPKWRVDCSRCSLVVYLPPNLHSAKVSREICEECEANLLALEWRKGHSPLPEGQTAKTGCLQCDELLIKLSDVKHGKSIVKRGRGRGRGRGGRARGRGRGRGRKKEDPLMSFHAF